MLFVLFCVFFFKDKTFLCYLTDNESQNGAQKGGDGTVLHKNSTRSIRVLQTGGGVHERRGNGYNSCLEFMDSLMS